MVGLHRGQADTGSSSQDKVLGNQRTAFLAAAQILHYYVKPPAATPPPLNPNFELHLYLSANPPTPKIPQLNRKLRAN